MQLQPLVQVRSEGTELRFVLARHDEERRSGVESMTVPHKPSAATTWLPILLQDSDGEACPGQMRRRGDATDTSADDDGGLAVHGRPACGVPICDDVSRLRSPTIPAIVSRLIRSPAPRLL